MADSTRRHIMLRLEQRMQIAVRFAAEHAQACAAEQESRDHPLPTHNAEQRLHAIEIWSTMATEALAIVHAMGLTPEIIEQILEQARRDALIERARSPAALPRKTS
jgi:hypothetical protein